MRGRNSETIIKCSFFEWRERGVREEEGLKKEGGGGKKEGGGGREEGYGEGGGLLTIFSNKV